MVELLVVIGIIAVLIGLLSPMITRAWRAGDRARTSSLLNAISIALEAYKQDHGDYPRVAGKPYQNASATDSTYNGARMLCRALIGPGPGVPKSGSDYSSVADGAGVLQDPSQPAGPANQETRPGPGFRTRGTQGKVYGPYLRIDQLKLGNPGSSTLPNPAPGLLAILDASNTPVLYYPGTGRPNVRAAGGYVKDYDPDNPGKVRPLYNARDNTGAMPPAVFAKMMGDANNNNMIDGTETAAYEGPFILWSSGPDEMFGSTAPTATLEKTDDITNFRK